LLSEKIYYTTEEIQTLRDICYWHMKVEPFATFTLLHIYESAVKIYSQDLEGKINGYLQPAWGFLHMTPLEDVPLYINEIPELARWRLMIAK
jgi:hypothetical protein